MRWCELHGAKRAKAFGHVTKMTRVSASTPLIGRRRRALPFMSLHIYIHMVASTALLLADKNTKQKAELKISIESIILNPNKNFK